MSETCILYNLPVYPGAQKELQMLTDVGLGPLRRALNLEKVTYHALDVSRTMMRIATSSALRLGEGLWLDTWCGEIPVEVIEQKVWDRDKKMGNVYVLGVTRNFDFNLEQICAFLVAGAANNQHVGDPTVSLRSIRLTDSPAIKFVARPVGPHSPTVLRVVLSAKDISRTGMMLISTGERLLPYSVGSSVKLTATHGENHICCIARVIRRSSPGAGPKPFLCVQIVRLEEATRNAWEVFFIAADKAHRETLRGAAVESLLAIAI